MALNFEIAPAVSNTVAPPIPKAQAWALNYSSSSRAASLSLLDLSQGVPKDPPHPSLLSSLASTSSNPETARYGSILGEPSFRRAFAAEVCHQYDLAAGEVGEEDVGITAGCNMAFISLLSVLCPPGSRCLMTLPAYFNASMALSLQSVEPLYIPADPSRGFKPDLAAAREALEKEGHGVRMIFLISPNNPTGSEISPEELEQWFELAQRKKVALVIDETYRDFVHGEDSPDDKKVPHGLWKRKDWRGTFVSLGSFSRYRIPGHRLGHIIASPHLLAEVLKVLDCMQICPPRAPQLALSPFLPSLRPDIIASAKALEERRALFKSTVEAVPGWKVDSIGGFFAYVSYPPDYAFASAVFGKKRKRLTSEDIAQKLCAEVGVLCLPGRYFMPPPEDELWDQMPDSQAKETVREDRWLRFSVANVGDEVVVQVGDRLRRMNKIMGMIADDAGDS